MGRPCDQAFLGLDGWDADLRKNKFQSQDDDSAFRGGTSSLQGKRTIRLTEGFTKLGLEIEMGSGKGIGMGQGGTNAVVTGSIGSGGGGSGSGGRSSGGGGGGGGADFAAAAAVSRLARRHSLEVMQGVDSLRGAARRRAYIWGGASQSFPCSAQLEVSQCRP